MLGLGNLLTKSGVIKKFPNDFSFNFDGSNDYLDLGDIASNVGYQGTSADDRSYSFWFRASNLTGYRTIFTSRDADRKDVVIYLQNNYIACEIRDISTRAGVVGNGGGTLSADTWYHVVITFDSSAFSSGNGHNMIKIYVNGSDVTDTSNTAPGVSGTASKTFIGHPAVAGGLPLYHIGFVDEFACWNTILSSSDVTKLASKPVDFSKASAYATDRTANLKLWLRAGDKVLPEEDTSIARSDFYTDFDGSNDYVDIGDFDKASGGSNGAFTVMAWFKANTIGAYDTIVSKWNNSGTLREWLFRPNDASKIEFRLFDESADKTIGRFYNTAISTGIWYHYACTYDGSTGSGSNDGVKIYENGVRVDDTDISGSDEANFAGIENLGGSLQIGSLYDSGQANFFDGAMSSVSLYQTALDAQTIKQFAKSRFTPMRDNRFSVVDFDGSDDYVVTPKISLDFTNISVSMWVNVDSFTSDDAFFAIADTDSNDEELLLYNLSADSNKFSVFFASGSSVSTSSYAIPTGQWVHLALTKSGTALK
jgi:hypothetical protein